MPLLDVSEVLDDPMFRDDSAVCIRTTETVNEFGEAVLTTEEIPFSGVIISGYSLPGGDGGLVRGPDGERSSNGITVMTRFPLQTGDSTEGTTADQILWQGTTFVATAQNDYSSIGGYFSSSAIRSGITRDGQFDRRLPRQTDALPAEDQALDRQLQAAVVGITGLDPDLVRPRWQPKPPKQPEANVDWVGFGVMRIVPDFMGAVVHRPDADGELGADELQRHEEIEVLASFYGPNAYGYAARLRDGLSIAQNREALWLQGLKLISAGSLVSMPELTGQIWIRRTDLSLSLRRQLTRTYPVRNLLSAEGEIDTDVETVTPGPRPDPVPASPVVPLRGAIHAYRPCRL